MRFRHPLISTPLPLVVVIGGVILYESQVDVTFSDMYKIAVVVRTPSPQLGVLQLSPVEVSPSFLTSLRERLPHPRRPGRHTSSPSSGKRA
jgi:hypothetical protein